MRHLTLVRQLAQQEEIGSSRALLAPVVPPGRVRVRLEGLVYQLRVHPPQVRGFGWLLPGPGGVAHWQSPASLVERDRYLRLWPRRQLRLLRRDDRGDWWAHPAQGQDLAEGIPLVVHEVPRGSLFEAVEAAWDGSNLWYLGPTPGSDPRLAEQMAEALAQTIAPDQLRIRHLTPQDRAAYACLYEQAIRSQCRVGPLDGHRMRLQQALAKGGGRLHSYSIDDDTYLVHWSDSLGNPNTSVIARRDLTVISSGVCLSDRDRDFDLTSLVGVLEEP